jgi:CelD/BcsL family acetyltransferase involved in cellulose biosynthesis
MFDPRSGRISFLADDESLTDYLGPLVLDADRLPPLAEALLEYLRDEIPGWRCFDANCLPVPFGFAEWLVEAADRLGFRFSLDQHELTAVLPLPPSWEAYLERLRPKQRHELRRKLRRLERGGEPPRLVTADAHTLEADLDAFVTLHRGSDGLKGKFMVPERATFFARLAHAFLPLGFLSLDFLEAGGERLASTFSFSFDGNFYLYNSAYDHAHRDLSPGLALVALLIRRSIRRGLGHFDFLRGRERYKFDLGAEPLPLHAVRISPSR